MTSSYDITRAHGGKDDSAIESGLINKINDLETGSNIEIRLNRISPWQGRDKVDIQDEYVLFRDRDDYTFSPVAIVAAVRVLHGYGFAGYFGLW